MKLTGLPPAPMNAHQAVYDSPQLRQPDFDPLDLLPERSADLLRKLRQRADDLFLLLPEFEKISEANAVKQLAVERSKGLTDPPQSGGFGLAADDQRVIAATKAVEKATAEARRVTEPRELRSSAWQTVKITTTNVEQWLRGGRPGNTQLETVEIVEPKLAKNEDVISALDRVRRRGRELQADLHRVRSAPYPSAHARAKIRQEVEQLVERGRPVLSGVIEHDSKLEFPRQLARAQVHNVPKAPAATAYFELVDLTALVAWLLKETLIKRLDEEIAAEADDKAALSPEAREKAEAEVMADLLAVERDEAALVWKAMEQNLPVEFRADTNPAAILSVKLVTAATVNGQGTSWQHAIDLVGLRR